MRIILNDCKNNGLSPAAPVQGTLTHPDRTETHADRIPAASASATVRRLRVSLGTFAAIEATGPHAEAALEAAFAAVSAIDRRLHPQSAGSDLARINTAPPGTAVHVDPSTCYLLALATRLNELTAGVFDPCLPNRSGRLRDIEVTPDNDVICHAPVALDFGGFAKGYAVDCAIDVLLSHGCSAGLVNAGGDLRVFGSHAEPILLRHPQGVLQEVDLADAALAVSDATSSQRPPEHQGYYSRANLASAANPLVHNYAAVRAKLAVIADALAKCVLLCSKDTAGAVLRAFNAEQLATAR